MGFQDFIFLGGNFVLGIVLIPTVLDEDSCIPLTTSLPTSLTLYAFTFSYFTLGMTLSAASTSIIALMWSYIAAFKNKKYDLSIRDLKPELSSG